MPIFHTDRVALIIPPAVGGRALLDHCLRRAGTGWDLADASIGDLGRGTLVDLRHVYALEGYTLIRVIRDPFCRVVAAALHDNDHIISAGPSNAAVVTGGLGGHLEQYARLCTVVAAFMESDVALKTQTSYWDDATAQEGAVVTVRCESLARDVRMLLPRGLGADYSGPVSGGARYAEFRYGPLLDMVEARYAADFAALGYPVQRRLVELVVARYREDLAWLAEACSQPTLDYDRGVDLAVYVYDKADNVDSVRVDSSTLQAALVSARTGVPACTVRVIPRSNVGREAETYLAHMLAHGERYRARRQGVFAAFLQGSVDDHLPATQLNGQPPGRVAYASGGALVAGLAADAMAHASGTSMTHAADHAFGPHAARAGFTITEWRGHTIQALARHDDPGKTHTLGTWWRARTGRPWPMRPVIWWVAALFAASAERIASVPTSLVHTLMRDLQDNDNPVAAHFLERTWALLLTQYL